MKKRLRKKTFRRRLWRPGLTEAQARKIIAEFGDAKDSFVWSLKVGDIVCDCRFNHQSIQRIEWHGGSDRDVVMADGLGCSASACLSPIDHTWNHPSS